MSSLLNERVLGNNRRLQGIIGIVCVFSCLLYVIRTDGNENIGSAFGTEKSRGGLSSVDVDFDTVFTDPDINNKQKKHYDYSLGLWGASEYADLDHHLSEEQQMHYLSSQHHQQQQHAPLPAHRSLRSNTLELDKIYTENPPYESKAWENHMREIQEGHRELLWEPRFPNAAWFLSFPESGISHILHLTHMSSGHSTATNYGHLRMDMEGNLIPTHDTEAIFGNGPVWYNTNLVKAMPASEAEEDKRWVPTRSHATGFCFFCEPKLYLHNHMNGFIWKAAQGVQKKNGWMLGLQYWPYKTDKIIHLYRDPYDQVVARFYSYVGLMRAFNPEVAAKYSLDYDGFRLWCAKQDEIFEEIEMAWIPKGLRKIANKVPCRQEFLKLGIFHNKVFKMTKEMENMKYMVVKFDEYSELSGRKELTIRRVNEFVRFPTIDESPPSKVAHGGKGLFDSFFTYDEKIAAALFMRNFLHPAVWYQIRSYLPRKKPEPETVQVKQEKPKPPPPPQTNGPVEVPPENKELNVGEIRNPEPLAVGSSGAEPMVESPEAATPEEAPPLPESETQPDTYDDGTKVQPLI